MFRNFFQILIGSMLWYLDPLCVNFDLFSIKVPVHHKFQKMTGDLEFVTGSGKPTYFLQIR